MTAELAERFCSTLAGVEGEGYRCDSAAHARVLARELVGERPVVVNGHPDLAGLVSDWRDAGAVVVTDPWDAQVGVTGVFRAVAATGTIVLVAGAGTPRSTALVPPVHVALVPLSRLVAGYPDAIDALGALEPQPSGVQLVTGPSRSGDIEFKLVRGVHGPGEVHVVLYPDD